MEKAAEWEYPGTRGLRVLYCVALLTLLPSMLFGASGWIGLATGGGLLGFGGPVGLLVLLALIIWRVVVVAQRPAALDIYAPVWALRAMRAVAILAMVFGTIAAAGIVLMPIAVLVPHSRDAGVGFFVAGMFLYMASNLAWLGAVLYEITRVLGRVMPRGALGERIARVLGIAGFSGLAVALAAAVHAGVLIRSEREAFARLCATAPQPAVREKAAEPFESVLVEDKPLQPLGRRIRTLELAVADQLAFVEECYPGTGRCMKVLNGRKGSSAYSDMRESKKAESVILFSVPPLELVSGRAGSRTYRLEYRISDTRNGRVLASAGEFVFDWGRASVLRRLIHSGATHGVEACGFAMREPHPFSSNVMRDRNYDAYARAEKELVISAMPARP